LRRYPRHDEEPDLGPPGAGDIVFREGFRSRPGKALPALAPLLP